jgi:hypothetical protein
MEIEEVKPKPNEFPNNRLWLLYGAPKTGKTTFASTWDNPLVIDLENGANNIECTRVRPRTMKELKEALTMKEINDYDTIIIDSVDILYSFIERNTITTLNKSGKTNYGYIGSFQFGSGWAHAKNSMKSWIYEFIIPLLQADKNVVIIGHEKSEVVKREGKEDETKYNISLPGQTGTLVTSLCEAIGRIHIAKGKHMISFSPAHDLGGSRIKALAGRVIPLNIKVMRSVIEKYTPKPAKTMGEIVDQAKE